MNQKHPVATSLKIPRNLNFRERARDIREVDFPEAWKMV